MITLLVLFLGAAVAIWYFLTYNSLVNARNATDQSWSGIEVELKRRLDLIGNLVEVAKGYASHEVSTLERITALRNQAQTSQADFANKTAGALQQATQQLFALAESYPDLKANQNFLSLQNELSNTENRVAERRHAYNQTVNNYLVLCRQIPSSLIASAHHFPERAFFDVPDEEVKNPVKVSLQ